MCLPLSCWLNEDATPTSNFQPIKLLDPDCYYKFIYLKANSADPDQKPTELDLHYLQKQDKTRVNLFNTTLSANSADDRLMLFFLIFFPRNSGTCKLSLYFLIFTREQALTFHFMQIILFQTKGFDSSCKWWHFMQIVLLNYLSK